VTSTAGILKSFYSALLERFGPQHWWPGESPFEVMVGAVLTQNTSWTNVEKAISSLKAASALDPQVLRDMPLDKLSQFIRPAGYYNLKAARLHNLLRLLQDDFGGDLGRFFAGPLDALRERLLAVKGIGPETADSMILYAAGRPSFVVDTYTFRVALRHGLVFDACSYDELKSLFEDNLPADAPLFNEYHALIVRLGKEYCRKKALCEGCPLEQFPHSAEIR